ncbi:ankyrin [Myriangium duriaei CBS 260.36]|uniref:Ankyrin n=1 Tax=Myriangium duriaei CBS 260.36 TaxID=1168546 RepID=A0A9P4MEP7_9PEZI|nr:ankyrin [Myriangium duriaei CBS 260.36]
MPRRLLREEYTVGWVCALPVELAAAKAMLDEEHDHSNPNASSAEQNIYCTGSIAGHNVVIVCLPAGRIGNNPAAAVATQMQSAFPGIRFGLMVGVGGGVPSAGKDVRLGDVVVSQPDHSFGGVVQYDRGKTTLSGFQRTGSLNSPPQILLSAVSTVQANEILERSTLSNYLSHIEHIRTFQRSRTGPDVLFETNYNHVPGPTCDHCCANRQQAQSARESETEVVVHYGTIASGNRVIKDAVERDNISNDLDGVLCFDMEAAGLMDSFPCLVIRGVCDYADSHKNKRWQPYAAGTAAAYAKELLTVIRPVGVEGAPSAEESVGDGSKRSFHASSADRASCKRRKVDIEGLPESSTVDTPLRILDIQRDPTSLTHEESQALLTSLKFEHIDEHQKSIKTAHARTCKWLLTNTQYIQWLDASKLREHHGFLWIKGKAGAGKSTIMKFALANARKRAKDCIVLSFFFHARGGELEKSTIGAYRSLLLQLFDCLPQLQSSFNSIGVSRSNIGADYTWSVELLETLFEQAVSSLQKTSVVCFVDALDECEEEQVREMIRFFKRIGDLTFSQGIRFRICLSSRPYPNITIQRGLELMLEGQEGHMQDIVTYIEAELNIGEREITPQIRAELEQKANGVFMWVVLVIGILNTESDHGNIHELRKKLQQIPGDLHELFQNLLTRDSHGKDRLVLCIQWVLFARKPLSPAQLYLALRSGVSPHGNLLRTFEGVTTEDIHRFIINSSKGFVEVTATGAQVQFIHESVKDFLLNENGLGQVWPELENDFRGRSHERLKHCCLSYIDVDIATISNTSEIILEDSDVPVRSQLAQRLPLYEYAINNVLHHADMAEGHGIPQAQFLADFPFEQWIAMHNFFEKFKIRRHTPEVSWPYMLAELNLVNLLRINLTPEQCVEVGNERYGCPLFAAVATGSLESLNLCMKYLGTDRETGPTLGIAGKRTSQRKPARSAIGRDFQYSHHGVLLCAAETGHEELVICLVNSELFEIDQQGPKGRTALWWASKNGCALAVESLLAASKSASAINYKKDWTQTTPLYAAAEMGHEAIVELLLNKGAKIDQRSGKGRIALLAAVEGGHTDTVKLLLRKGADIVPSPTKRDNVLEAASNKGFMEIVSVLLDHGSDLNELDGISSCALAKASLNGHQEIVKFLLEKGANANKQGGEFGNALQAASFNGHKEIVSLLLERGAKINAQGGIYGTALQAASLNGHKEIVNYLLRRGANVNEQGGIYGSALQAASIRGHKELVMLLLAEGAEINKVDEENGNALELASSAGHKEIVMLLLEKGASVNKQGEICGKSLQEASTRGQTEVVAILLDRGADIHMSNGRDGNALYAASFNGRLDTVLLLLDRGADINLQCGRFGSALQAASYRGHSETVWMLLVRGADINMQGGEFGNALQAASYIGQVETVTLLLERGADINMQGGRFGNALQAASFNGHEESVRLLLDSGANVDILGGECSHALLAAAQRGHHKIVELLWDKGSDNDIRDEINRCALKAAADNGHESVVMIFLDRGNGASSGS